MRNGTPALSNNGKVLDIGIDMVVVSSSLELENEHKDILSHFCTSL